MILFFLYVVFFFMTAFAYYYYLYRIWEYQGFVYSYNNNKLLISVFVIFFFSFLSPRTISLRSFFLKLAITVQLIPSLVLYSMGDMPTSSAVIVWMALFTMNAVSAIHVPRLSIGNIDPKHVTQVLGIATAVLIFAFFALGGLANFNLDLRLVYDFRTVAAESLPGVFNYLTPIFTKIVIPFGLVYSIHSKKYISAIIFFSFSIIIFGFSSHKGIIFYPIMSIFVYFYYINIKKFSYIIAIFIFLILISLIDSYIYINYNSPSISGWYSSIFVRRGLMSPALLDYYYIDFFSKNVSYFWSSSRITLGLIDSPYGITAPHLIGDVYFGDINKSANTGYIGAGFAQAGIAGTLVYATGVGLTLAVLQSHGRSLGDPFVAATMMGQVATMFLSADFLTLFLTHGMLVSLVLLALVRAPQSRGNRLTQQPLASVAKVTPGR